MSQSNVIAVSIFLGFFIVALAYLYTNNQEAVAVVGTSDGTQLAIKRTGDDAWTYGNKKADTYIVEFSDYECPFCAKVHPTLKRIVDESDGKIAWQYRHLPLPSHKSAEEAAVASECVGRLSGNDSFWEYSDTLLSNQKQINAAYLKEQALALSIDEADFTKCMADESLMDKVVQDQKTARALGGNGTPFSVIVKNDGSLTPVTGALPYQTWLSLIAEENEE